MKKILLLPVCLLLQVNNHTTAQITFQKTYGGTGGDYAHCVQQTADGGYIIGGFTDSYTSQGAYVGYLIKTNNIGDTLWTRVGYGGKINSVIQTADGGYAITGFDQYNPFLIKLDANGILLWKTNYDIAQTTGGFSVKQTFDGGFVFVSSASIQSTWNACLFKTDSVGNTAWIKRYEGESFAYGVRQTPDHGYVITGTVHGTEDILLIKTDSLGDVSWTPQEYNVENDYGWSVLPTSDGGYIIAGSSGPTDQGAVYVVKTDTTGTLLWSKTYGGFILYSNQERVSLENTSDGNYFITAGKEDGSLYVLKIRPTGDVLWAKTYGAGNEYPGSGQQTLDGGFVIAGTTDGFGAGGYDIYLIKTDSLGNSGCYENSVTVTPGVPATETQYYAPFISSLVVVQDTIDYSIVAGATVTTLCMSTGTDKIPEGDSFQIINNPASNSFTIKFNSPVNNYDVSIFNLLGAKVLEEYNLQESESKIKVDNISSGIYFVNVFEGGKQFLKKLIIAHN